MEDSSPGFPGKLGTLLVVFSRLLQLEISHPNVLSRCVKAWASSPDLELVTGSEENVAICGSESQLGFVPMGYCSFVLSLESHGMLKPTRPREHKKHTLKF